jgi:hypothetical protein
LNSKALLRSFAILRWNRRPDDEGTANKRQISENSDEMVCNLTMNFISLIKALMKSRTLAQSSGEITMSQNHRNLESIVEALVHEHFELDESLEKVIWIKSGKTPAIRLLEINPETPPAGEVLSFYFPPSEETPYALYLAEIRPEEWLKILQNEIPLPEGWNLENHQVFSRELVAV